uniref:Endonuclease/exonuclease/phosphatase domain-containing protein n=1 Tax=Chenopodium quinoa TaxID=63459 RepID=A0A803LVS9_CHEQI
MSYILSWNCRGLGSISAVNALKRVVFLESLQLVFLSETRLKKHEAEKIKNKINFSCAFVVECEGEGRKRSGGLMLLWKDGVDVDLMSFSQNHINVLIDSLIDGGWRFTSVYGFPEEERKHKTGLLMEILADSQDKPWLCGGDFNLMLVSSEKQGGGNFRMEEADIFRRAVAYCQFVDMGYLLVTTSRGPIIEVELITYKRGDYYSIEKEEKMYHFEEMWLRDDNAWEGGGDIVSKIDCTSSRLSKWSKEKFSDFAKEMADCRAHMKCLMSEYQSDDIIAQMRALDDRMDELESREEAYWRQRRRQDWLKNGDKNMTFFHTKVKQWAARNTINTIKDDAGMEHRDEEEIIEVLVSYFEELLPLVISLIWMP